MELTKLRGFSPGCAISIPPFLNLVYTMQANKTRLPHKTGKLWYISYYCYERGIANNL